MYIEVKMFTPKKMYYFILLWFRLYILFSNELLLLSNCDWWHFSRIMWKWSKMLVKLHCHDIATL